MSNYDADDIFIETDEHGLVCLGGAPFGWALIVTRLGGFEVWDKIPDGKCIAGEGYAGKSEIRLKGKTLFYREAIQEE